MHGIATMEGVWPKPPIWTYPVCSYAAEAFHYCVQCVYLLSTVCFGGRVNRWPAGVIMLWCYYCRRTHTRTELQSCSYIIASVIHTTGTVLINFIGGPGLLEWVAIWSVLPTIQLLACKQVNKAHSEIVWGKIQEKGWGVCYLWGYLFNILLIFSG